MVKDRCFLCFGYFFFNYAATTEIYTLSLHDALPIFGFHKQMDNRIKLLEEILSFRMQGVEKTESLDRKSGSAGMPRPISYAVFCLKKKSAIFISFNIDVFEYLAIDLVI